MLRNVRESFKLIHTVKLGICTVSTDKHHPVFGLLQHFLVFALYLCVFFYKSALEALPKMFLAQYMTYEYNIMCVYAVDFQKI
jgi:hypothetical protein